MRFKLWLMAARPRTLPAAVAPVLVGTALAASEDSFRLPVFLAALFGAVLIQIGANLANDYSDAKRGADTEGRLGPKRVTASGLVTPVEIKRAIFITFAAAMAVGSYLVVTAGWVILVVGLLSILAGVLYTGGPRPYGYSGWGEVFVFLFFGVVAVTGSYFVQTHQVTWEALALSVPVGLLEAAILIVNNVRDIDTDAGPGKRTLAVRLGRQRTRQLYAGVIFGAFLVVVGFASAMVLSPWMFLPLATAPLALQLIRVVGTQTAGPPLNQALANTGMLALSFSLLLSIGLLVS